MRNVLTIFLKELKRVFTDKRMLISLFLPGVLIYFVYTIMGSVMTKVVTQSSTKDTNFQVAYTNNFNSSSLMILKISLVMIPLLMMLISSITVIPVPLVIYIALLLKSLVFLTLTILLIKTVRLPLMLVIKI